MMNVFYSKDAQFELTDDEFSAFIEKADGGGRVWIPRLKVFLSNLFIWAGEKPDDRTRGRLHDGTIVEKINGGWRCLYAPEVRLDPIYYPEIAKDEVMTEREWQANKKLDKTPGAIGKLK